MLASVSLPRCSCRTLRFADPLSLVHCDKKVLSCYASYRPSLRRECSDAYLQYKITALSERLMSHLVSCNNRAKATFVAAVGLPHYRLSVCGIPMLY